MTSLVLKSPEKNLKKALEESRKSIKNKYEDDCQLAMALSRSFNSNVQKNNDFLKIYDNDDKNIQLAKALSESLNISKVDSKQSKTRKKIDNNEDEKIQLAIALSESLNISKVDSKKSIKKQIENDKKLLRNIYTNLYIYNRIFIIYIYIYIYKDLIILYY